MSVRNGLPQHIGLIPDGNRRWARREGVNLHEAYLRGYMNVKRIAKYFFSRGVRYITVYVLSLENCTRRPPDEKSVIENIAIHGMRDLRSDPELVEKGIGIRVLGDPSLFSKDLDREAYLTVRAREAWRKGLLILLICYSGRHEALKYASMGMVPPSLLYPRVDLLIRTGGARRISGFLPLAVDYAELYFTDVLWPDFTVADAKRALEWFSRQKRNFGR